ncbi:OLC1v1000223C1 [Oldenlandia corymbosa var. corymbosa]|uniref:OLC1v1000223C1 n=1 Tax=Oldenlandia corymbosa var. corymbosa TaxID=529605 RepID=A0AAV1D2T8_OLDCO|nr:OLC1v1000223C1 [Oldenlandia corymbosa var. corymbosa]
MEGGSSGSTAKNGGDQVGLPDAQGGAASILVAETAETMATNLAAHQLFLMSSEEFTKLCTSMAKGIDYAIANNEVPRRARSLPPLLIQVYQARVNEAYLLGLMMLTLSVQCACKLEWFTNQDTEDLLKVCKEVIRNYSDPDQICVGPRHALCWLSLVTSRYCPNTKIDLPGCRFCVASVPITKLTVSPGRDKISFFTIQMDQLRTSMCTFIPLGVSIQINGNDVEGRTTLSLLRDEMRPFPTDVTTMLKLGVNCLQAIGQVTGDLLVVLAVTSGIESCSDSQLPDNVGFSASTDSDQSTPENQTRDLPSLPELRTKEEVIINKKLMKKLTNSKIYIFNHFQNFVRFHKRICWTKHIVVTKNYVTICVAQSFSALSTNAEGGLMVLTMSIQSACKLEWFSNQDTQALLKIGKEVMKNYSDPDQVLSRVTMSRSSQYLHEVPQSYRDIGLVLSRIFSRAFTGHLENTILLITPLGKFQVKLRMTRNHRIYMYGDTLMVYMDRMGITEQSFIHFIMKDNYELITTNFGKNGCQVGLLHSHIMGLKSICYHYRVGQESYSCAIISSEYWEYLHYSTCDVALLKVGPQIMEVDLLTVAGQTVGFCGPTWKYFYKFYGLEPEYHIVFCFEAGIFTSNVFHFDGSLLHQERNKCYHLAGNNIGSFHKLPIIGEDYFTHRLDQETIHTSRVMIPRYLSLCHNLMTTSNCWLTYKGRHTCMTLRKDERDHDYENIGILPMYIYGDWELFRIRANIPIGTQLTITLDVESLVDGMDVEFECEPFV